MLVYEHGDLCPVTKLQLPEDARDVALDRALGYHELLCDFTVVRSACHQLKHLPLAFRQFGDRSLSSCWLGMLCIVLRQAFVTPEPDCRGWRK
jgi:hypothetical protein